MVILVRLKLVEHEIRAIAAERTSEVVVKGITMPWSSERPCGCGWHVMPVGIDTLTTGYGLETEI